MTEAETKQRLAEATARLEAGTLADAEVEAVAATILQVATENRFALVVEASRLGTGLTQRWPALAQNRVLQRTLAYLGWVAKDAVASIAAGKRCLRLEPENPQLYVQMGWVHLTDGHPDDAFLALSAGLSVAPNHEVLKAYRRLAELLMRGISPINFTLDGQTYLFGLTCFSGQAMETAVHHAHGGLTEIEELRFVRDTVGKARVVVEVGTLVGNHTVFFARNLRPERIYCFDVDPNSIHHTTQNLRLNVPDDQDLELVIVEKAVGDQQKTIDFGGRSVEMTTLSAEVTEPVDFVKIDVDGMEIAALEGARQLFIAHRPRALIEVAHDNGPAFARFVESIGYRVHHEFKRPADTNYFIAPT
jgi:hypothetical protein